MRLADHTESGESSSDGFDRSKTGAEHVPPVPLKLAVREVAKLQIVDALEGGPSKLNAHLVFAIVRGDEEQPPHGLSG